MINMKESDSRGFVPDSRELSYYVPDHIPRTRTPLAMPPPPQILVLIPPLASSTLSQL